MKIKGKKPNEVSARLKKWRKELKIIGDDLTRLFVRSEDFEELRKVVSNVMEKPRNNTSFFISFTAFVNSVLDWYISFIAMGIRRQLKIDKDSFSLYKLLEEIEKNSLYISKEYFISLYNVDKEVPIANFNQTNNLTDKEKKVIESRIKKEISKRKKRSAEKKWEELVGKGNDFLSPEVVKKDSDKLKLLGKKIEDLADRYIAHIDRKRERPKLNLNDFNEELSKIKEILNKYSIFLTGHSCYQSPVFQYKRGLFFEELEKWLSKNISEEAR